MANRNFNALVYATVGDRAAKNEALRMGLMATQPLSPARHAQLCMLGERMMQAALRKRDAERDVCDTTLGGPAPLDILLPC
jgi:hypothetical protein